MPFKPYPYGLLNDEQLRLMAQMQASPTSPVVQAASINALPSGLLSDGGGSGAVIEPAAQVQVVRKPKKKDRSLLMAVRG
jgi:hypothetical protein